MISQENIIEKEAALFDPKTKAIPVFDMIDIDMGMGDGVYAELLPCFLKHYNFLLARVGKDPVPAAFSNRKLLWYMLWYLHESCDVFVELLVHAVEREAKKKTLFPGAFFLLEVESIHMYEAFFNRVKASFEPEQIGVKPGRLAAQKGLSGYVDLSFGVWAQVSGDGQKIYLTQVADTLLGWFCLEFFSLLRVTFSWSGFLQQSGESKFSTLIKNYVKHWESLEKSQEKGDSWSRFQLSKLPSVEEFSFFFTTFRSTATSGKAPEFYRQDSGLGYDFLEMWGDQTLLMQAYMDLFTSVYLKFFLGAFPERDGKLTYARRSEDLSAYIWGKPTLFFHLGLYAVLKVWRLLWKFPYYAEGKLAFQGDKLWEDPLPFAREKIASLPLYNPSLIDEKQKEELLFFVDQAKKQQIKKYARNLEEAEQWQSQCMTYFLLLD